MGNNDIHQLPQGTLDFPSFFLRWATMVEMRLKATAERGEGRDYHNNMHTDDTLLGLTNWNYEESTPHDVRWVERNIKTIREWIMKVITAVKMPQ